MADEQKYITIKAKDGTMKKVPLAEFQKMQKTTNDERRTTNNKQEIGNKKQETENNEQETGNWKQETTNDEQRAVVQKAPASVRRDSTLSDVLSMLDFSVSKDLEGRLGALVDSRISGIRTDEQVRDYATRSVGDGGLGFSETQADVLVAAIDRAAGAEAAVPDSRPEMPVKKREFVEEKSASVKTMAGGEEKQITAPQKMEAQMAPVLSPSVPSAAPAPARVPARPAPGGQGMAMRDVHPPANGDAVISPIDELGLMRLVDFRRLGGSLHDQKERLLRKFDTLRKESYVLYLDARKAWFTSPLYRRYQDIIVQAINSGQPVQGFLDGGDDLDAGEFATLIEVNRAINI